MSKHLSQSDNIKALEQSLNDHMEICSLKRKVKRLKAELARLRASSFVTAVPVEQYERVVKAGDAMALTLQADYNGVPYEPHVIINAIIYWRAAKEGMPSV